MPEGDTYHYYLILLYISKWIVIIHVSILSKIIVNIKTISPYAFNLLEFCLKAHLVPQSNGCRFFLESLSKPHQAITVL